MTGLSKKPYSQNIPSNLLNHSIFISIYQNRTLRFWPMYRVWQNEVNFKEKAKVDAIRFAKSRGVAGY